MEIVKLALGEVAPEDSDCINIDEKSDGRFRLSGSALLRCGDSDQAESVALIGGEPYHSFATAEEAGLAWAAEHCVEQVYVSRSDPAHPLPPHPA